MMTDKQKEAIAVLNRLNQKACITEEEYFMLMDFVVSTEPQISYIPYSPNITPLTYPTYPTYEVTCKNE